MRPQQSCPLLSGSARGSATSIPRQLHRFNMSSSGSAFLDRNFPRLRGDLGLLLHQLFWSRPVVQRFLVVVVPYAVMYDGKRAGMGGMILPERRDRERAQ